MLQRARVCKRGFVGRLETWIEVSYYNIAYVSRRDLHPQLTPYNMTTGFTASSELGTEVNKRYLALTAHQPEWTKLSNEALRSAEVQCDREIQKLDWLMNNTIEKDVITVYIPWFVYFHKRKMEIDKEFDMRVQELVRTERRGKLPKDLRRDPSEWQPNEPYSSLIIEGISNGVEIDPKTESLKIEPIIELVETAEPLSAKEYSQNEPTLMRAELPVRPESQEPVVSTKHAFTQTPQSKVSSLRVVSVDTTSLPPKVDVRGDKHAAPIERPQPSSQVGSTVAPKHGGVPSFLPWLLAGIALGASGVGLATWLWRKFSGRKHGKDERSHARDWKAEEIEEGLLKL